MGTQGKSSLTMKGIFPPDLLHSLKIGEESGNVEGMLMKIAEYYRLDAKNRTDTLMTIIRQ